MWLLLVLLLASTDARADVGPIDTSCSVEKRCSGKGVECRYVNSDPSKGDLKCEEDAKARGLEKVCTRGGGTVGDHVYCPAGSGKKSSGCTVGAEDPSAIAGLALLVVVASRRGVRRRLSRRSPSP